MRMAIVGGMGGQFLFAVLLSSIVFASVPVSSQSTTCDVSPSSDWSSTEDPGDYLSVGVPGYGNDRSFGFGGDSGLNALDKDISTEWSDGAWEGFPGIHV